MRRRAARMACKRASRTELPHHTAMRRTMQAADIAGIRAFAVHAKDEAARAFYPTFDFIPSPTDPLHLFRRIKDLRRVAGET